MPWHDYIEAARSGLWAPRWRKQSGAASSYSQDDSEDYAQSAYPEMDRSVEGSFKVLFPAQPS